MGYVDHFMIVAFLNSSGDTVLFSFLIQNRKSSEEVKVKAVIGPGNTPEPVLTIMLPDED